MGLVRKVLGLSGTRTSRWYGVVGGGDVQGSVGRSEETVSSDRGESHRTSGRGVPWEGILLLRCRLTLKGCYEKETRNGLRVPGSPEVFLPLSGFRPDSPGRGRTLVVGPVRDNVATRALLANVWANPFDENALPR